MQHAVTLAREDVEEPNGLVSRIGPTVTGGKSDIDTFHRT